MSGPSRAREMDADEVSREIAQAMAAAPDLARCKEEVLARYEIADPGIPFRVTIENAVRAWRDPESGRIVATSIPAFEELVAQLAIFRAHLPWKLRGDEIRFLRRVLDKSGKDFAKAIGLKPETLSRCEHGRQPLGEQTERLLRLYVVEMLQDRAPAALICRRDILQMGLRSRPDKPLAFTCRGIRLKLAPEQPGHDAWELSEAA